MAFTWNGERQDNFDIYLKLIGSGPPVAPDDESCRGCQPCLVAGRAHHRISPPAGGRSQRAFAHSRAGRPRAQTGGNASRTAGSSRLRSLAWSPDGRWLVVAHRERDEQGEALFLISAQTGEKRRLTQPPRGYLGDLTPAFSPDGRAVAFSRLSGPGASEVYLQPLSGDFETAGEARRLTTNGRWAVEPGLDCRWTVHPAPACCPPGWRS